jgi:hypothetical protein
MAIHMGYMGYCKIAGVNLACTSLSITKKTDPLFYDHIYGLRDQAGTGPESVKGDGGDGGFVSRQKGIYRSSRTTSSGSASGPLLKGHFKELMDTAIKGEVVAADFGLYFGKKKALLNAFITSLTIDVKAGEAASFSVELIGTDIEDLESPPEVVACEKIITWDKCGIASELTGDVMSFSLSISNPAIPIFVSGADDTLGPKEIRIGIQEVKGSISVYEATEWPGGEISGITFTVDGASYVLSATYSGPTNSPSTGPFVSTIPFTGASDTFAWVAG